jgi:lysophospholipase L1-like esterase
VTPVLARHASPAAREPLKFVFFADSIAFGQRVSPHLIWAVRLSRELHEQVADGSAVVANHSVNGDTTRTALERIPSHLQNERPDVVYVQFGLNDCNFWITDEGHPRVSIAAFEANLHEIVRRARLFGARKVLIGTNHLTKPGGPMEAKISKKAPCSYRDHIIQYNEAIRRVALTGEAKLVDVETAWTAGLGRYGESAELLQPDGIHLSAKGHDFYHEIVGPPCLEAWINLSNDRK